MKYNYSISTETVNGQLFCHSRVFCKWSKEVYLDYINEIRRMAKENGYPPVFCYIPLDNKKLNKFVKKLGFRLVRKVWSKKFFAAIYKMETKCYK